MITNLKFVKAGFLQGSVLGAIFFLIYINDLLQEPMPDVKLFVMVLPYFCLLIAQKLLLQ